ncbi:hypothetical protein MK489_14370 [Myxococcota bacterium]|nr:hypothetical protein [Myxococcota bacterium]
MTVNSHPRPCVQSLGNRFDLSNAVRSFVAGLLALGVLGLTACGDPPVRPSSAEESSAASRPTPESSPQPRDPGDPAACAPYTIFEGPVDLLERVTLVGLTSAEEIDGIRIEGPESDLPVFLGQAEDSGFFFTAPIHPDLAGEAGSLRVWLDLASMTEESCDLGTIEVPALPPSDSSEADEVLDLLEQAALSMLQSYEFDAESFEPLASGNSAMDLSLARLHRALFYEESPTRISVIRSELAALPDSERSFLGSILKETRFRETLEDMIALYEPQRTPAVPVMGASVAAMSPSNPLLPQPPASEDSGSCYPANVAPEVIGSAGDLSQAMVRAKEAEDVTERWKSSRRFSSNWLNYLGVFSTSLHGKALSLMGGGLILYMDLSERYTATLLPSKLEEVRMQASVNPINEDYMDKISSLPVWDAYATASSQGADLKKDLFQIVLAIAGAVPSSKTVGLGLIQYGDATNHAFQSIPDDAKCFSIPGHTWSNIRVTGREWLEEDPKLSGEIISIALQDPNRIVPVDIGTTNIEIMLSREKFPCADCSVGNRSDDIDITVREKEVVFSRSAFPIPSPSGTVTVTGAIQNSSRPDFWSLDYDDSGVNLIGVERQGASFALTFQGKGDPDAFPVGVRVKSESTKLPGQSENPWFETKIVLEREVKIEHDGDDCVGTDEEVILSATVIGLNMPDVSWEASVGADLIPVSSTEAVFSAMDPGIYTITAIAAEDGGTRGSIEIAVQACDFELYVNSRARVSTVKSDSHPNCNPGSHEEPFIEEEQHGLPWGESWVDTETFRNPDRWTEGGSFSVDLFASESITSTYEIMGQCFSSVALAEGQIAGELSSRDDGRVVDIDLEMGGRHNCVPVHGDVEDCKGGSADLSSSMYFVLEHEGWGTQSYDYEVDLDCTADTGGVPVQVITSVVIMNAAGNWQNGVAQHVLDNSTLGAFSRVSFLRCSEGQPISVQETFDFQDYLPPGASSNSEIEPYTAAVWVSFSANASMDPGNMRRFETIHQSSVQGSVSLRPVMTR